MGSHIWRLHIKSSKYLSLIPHDINYFRDHFDGRPMALQWTPPPITISGKSKKVPDIVGWKSKPISLRKAVFSKGQVPPIFKVAVSAGKPFGDIFVTRALADIAVENRLSGFELADPGRDSLTSVLSGEAQNVVPGIVG